MVEAERPPVPVAYGAAMIPAEVPNHEHSKSGLQSQRDEMMASLTGAKSVTARALGDTAQMLPAQIQSGIYRGPIVGETSHHFIQRQSAHCCITHGKDLLDRQPQVGEHVRIQYAHAKGAVRECREPVNSRERGR